MARDRRFNQRSRRAHESESGKQRERTRVREVATSHEAGRVRAVRELDGPPGDEGADGWSMTSSDCVLREGSGRPTSAGKPGRCRNTGDKGKYGVGRPSGECQATVAKQRKERTKGPPESAEADQQSERSGSEMRLVRLQRRERR